MYTLTHDLVTYSQGLVHLRPISDPAVTISDEFPTQPSPFQTGVTISDQFPTQLSPF